MRKSMDPQPGLVDDYTMPEDEQAREDRRLHELQRERDNREAGKQRNEDTLDVEDGLV